MVVTTDGKHRFMCILHFSKPLIVTRISQLTQKNHNRLYLSSQKRNPSHSWQKILQNVRSFTLGKGKADWGPLTVYAVTHSGDICAICPYMPQNP